MEFNSINDNMLGSFQLKMESIDAISQMEL